MMGVAAVIGVLAGFIGWALFSQREAVTTTISAGPGVGETEAIPNSGSPSSGFPYGEEP